MKKLFALMIVVLLVFAGGCGTPVQQTTVEQPANMGGYSRPSVEMVTQTAAENGLKGTKIFVEGRCNEVFKIEGCMYMKIKSDQSDWIFALPDPDLSDGKLLNKSVYSNVVCFGAYQGFSETYKMPSASADAVMFNGGTVYSFTFGGDSSVFSDDAGREPFRSVEAIVKYLNYIGYDVTEQNYDYSDETSSSDTVLINPKIKMYNDVVIPAVTALSNGIAKISDLSTRAGNDVLIMLDEGWKEESNEAISSVRKNCEIIQNYSSSDVPISFEEAHRQLKHAATFYKKAADKYEYGIENYDSESITEATAAVLLGNSFIDSATEALPKQ